MSYTVDWFVPYGGLTLQEQAEAATSDEERPSSPATAALRQTVAQEIQKLHASLKIGTLGNGDENGCWIQSDNDQCLVPYVELGNGTGMVQGGLGSDKESNEQLLRVYSIFERHGYVGYDPQLGKVFQGVEGFLGLHKKRRWKLW